MSLWYQQGQALISNIKSISLPEHTAALWRIGQCGIFLKYRDTVILVDPVLTPMLDSQGNVRTHFAPPFGPDADFPADAVFCTHNHRDHLNQDTLAGIASSHPRTAFFFPSGVREEVSPMISDFSHRVTWLRQNASLQITPHISVTAVAAAHDCYRTDEQGNEKALGYLFCLDDLRIFHAGDTLATERLVNELNTLGHTDAALLPVNGRDWVRESQNIIGNMNHQEAALFADRIRCDTVIPLHYDMMQGNEENPLIFAIYMETHYPSRAYHILRLGESYLLTKRGGRL